MMAQQTLRIRSSRYTSLDFDFEDGVFADADQFCKAQRATSPGGGVFWQGLVTETGDYSIAGA
jgi:hypothetical protein